MHTAHRFILQYDPTTDRQPDAFLIALLSILVVCSIIMRSNQSALCSLVSRQVRSLNSIYYTAFMFYSQCISNAMIPLLPNFPFINLLIRTLAELSTPKLHNTRQGQAVLPEPSPTPLLFVFQLISQKRQPHWC